MHNSTLHPNAHPSLTPPTRMSARHPTMLPAMTFCPNTTSSKALFVTPPTTRTVESNSCASAHCPPPVCHTTHLHISAAPNNASRQDLLPKHHILEVQVDHCIAAWDAALQRRITSKRQGRACSVIRCNAVYNQVHWVMKTLCYMDDTTVKVKSDRFPRVARCSHCPQTSTRTVQAAMLGSVDFPHYVIRHHHPPLTQSTSAPHTPSTRF